MLFYGLLGVCAAVTVFLTIRLINSVIQYKKANNEYASLVTEYVEETPKKQKVVTTYSGIGTTEVVSSVNTDYVEEVNKFKLPDLTIDFASLVEVNKDCIGWIYVPGTRINYPVVQSSDNIDYVSKTYSGQENIAGCIFSDCRIVSPFTQKTILYGHNMKNGTMFHDLFSIEKNSDLKDIWILMCNGTVYHYTVDAVKRVDMLDKDVYSIASTYDDTLVLSTCIKDTSRLVVIAKRDWYYFT